MAGQKSHNHTRCIRSALDRAESVCSRHRVRLTPLRRRVLELVWASHEAVKAYELLPLLNDGGPAANPPTVYRALEFLQQHGLIHRIESLNAYVGCPNPQESHTAQLLICEQCGLVDEISLGVLEKTINREADKRAFLVRRQTVEVQGVCSACQHKGGVA